MSKRASLMMPRNQTAESSDERARRDTDNFSHVERLLPRLAGRVSFPLLDNLSSYLGRNNPLAHPVGPQEDSVWIFDNTANVVSGKSSDDAHMHMPAPSGPQSPSQVSAPAGSWEVEYVTAYFKKASGKAVTDGVADVAKAIGLAKGDAAEKTIEKRLHPFFDTILPARTVAVSIDAKQPHKLGPSGRDGISTDVVALPAAHRSGDVIQTTAQGFEQAVAQTVFAGPDGWAVISDIDDTIKRTLTNDPVGILKTTFVEEPTPIAGMPELYKHFVTALDRPPFWYLSASPYNLYSFLRSFRETHFPGGTLVLRDSSWMNLAGFLASLTKGTQTYKVDRIRKIHKAFPRRKVVCLGDSTQSDPEAYAQIYRECKGWVRAIFIRKVLDVTEIGDIKPGDQSAERNSDERFEKAFEGVPRDVWTVFENPEELYGKLDVAIKERGD